MGNANTPNERAQVWASDIENVPGWFGIGGTSLSSPLWGWAGSSSPTATATRGLPGTFLAAMPGNNLHNIDPGNHFHDITGLGHQRQQQSACSQ